MLKIDVQKRQGRFTVAASFTVESAGVTALFGPSGAGKTSIINMVAGLVRPDEGHVIVNGRTVFDSVKGIDIPPEQRGFGYVFQDGRLFPHLSVRSNLTYGMKLVRVGNRTITFDEVVELLGIEHLLERRVTKLSGGEKQRIAIGRALLASPTLLLMDEPLASLDAGRKAEVLPFVERLPLRLSIPILYVSHSLDEVLNLADTLVLLEGGRVRSMGPIEDILNRGGLNGHNGSSARGTVITTVVDHHDSSDGLTYLQFNGSFLKVPLSEVTPGTRIRARIDAGDVDLCLSRPSNTTMDNIFPAIVERISEGNSARVNVRLNMGAPVSSTITRRAVRELGLAMGQQVFVMIRRVTISGRGNSLH